MQKIKEIHTLLSESWLEPSKKTDHNCYSLCIGEGESKIFYFLARLFVFSNVLLQEAKKIETLKNFLVSSFENSMIEMEALQSRFEDLREAKQAEKTVYPFLLFVFNCDFWFRERTS